jgi:Eukaryotic aspartyl protease
MENNVTGSLHIGGFDAKYSPKDFFVYPMRYNNRYSVYITEITAGSSKISSEIEAIVDPSVPYLYLPYDYIVKIIEAMAAFYGSNCQQALCEVEGHLFFGSTIVRPPSEFPDIVIGIGELKIVLKGFLIKGDNGQYSSIIKSCWSYAIIGSPVLEQIYLVVDMENSRIAIAPLKVCRPTDDLILLNQWEQTYPVVLLKLFMVVSSLMMIIVIGW